MQIVLDARCHGFTVLFAKCSGLMVLFEKLELGLPNWYVDDLLASG
mgnify:CR=1 FL=1